MKLASYLEPNELKTCRDVGCDPEVFAEKKARQIATQKGLDPDKVIAEIKARPAAAPVPPPGCAQKFGQCPSCASKHPGVGCGQAKCRTTNQWK